MRSKRFSGGVLLKYWIGYVVGLFCYCYSLGAQTEIPSIGQLTEMISLDSMQKHVAILGADSLEGRATGTTGGEIAAEYLARQLQKYQLTPAGSDHSYFQKIPMHGSLPLVDSQLRLYAGNDWIHDFELGEDYLLFKSGAQTFVPVPVDLVFVGYGIIAPEYDYDDYHTVDAAGKIVIFLEGEPVSPDSDYFSGTLTTIYSLPESKQRMAISQGALGSILIADSSENLDQKWEELRREFSFEDISLAYNITGHLSILLDASKGELLFEQSPFNLKDIRQMAESHSMQSFPLFRSISFKGEFIERDFIASNVLGIIPGSHPDRLNSFLLISAHYDHLGIGPVVAGDSIYNGVADNALGVAAALEIARIFSSLPGGLPRSIIILFSTGEEKGLLGSYYYTDHPVKPLYQTIANINIDGLAMFQRFKDVVGVGAELSSLKYFMEKAAQFLNLEVSTLPEVIARTESFARSDQIAFAQSGIPSLIIIEGLSQENCSQTQALTAIKNWMDKVYHTPFDDYHQQINYDAVRQHTQIILATAYFLLNTKKVPEWNPGVNFQTVRLQTIAEKR